MEFEELVLSGKNGDINSFIKLIENRQETIFRIARAYTQNSYDAEDCISEAVIHAFDRLGQLKNDHKFYVWFISILINICRKRYRSAAKTEKFIPEIHGEIQEEITTTAENTLLVENLLKHLNKNEREILVLRYLRDFSLEETAEILGIPEGTVKSRLNRTVAKIKLRYRRLFSNEV